MSQFFLSGKIAAIKTVVDTISSRLTATRAAYLDAAISTRAPSASALSKATWTNARAALLDSIATILTRLNSIAKGAATLSPWATSRLIDLGTTLERAIVPSTATSSWASTYVSVIDVTGQGVINFLALGFTTNSSGNYGWRITIDGVEVAASTSIFSSSGHVNDGALAVGAVARDGSDNITGIAFDQIPFNVSFKLEVYSSAQAGTLTSYYMYRTI